MSEIAIEDLSMSDLVELFKKQVSIHGIAEFIPLLMDRNVRLDDQDDQSVSNGEKSPVNSSTDESVDILSDSSFSTAENDNDEFLNTSSDEEDDLADGDQSDDDSVIGEGVKALDNLNLIHLHDPPIFATRHCPPFASIDDTLYGECDCNDFGMDICGQTDDFQFFEALRLGEEYNISLNTVDSIDRITSNVLRKRLYKMLFHATDFGILEKNERRKLPNCVVARIRQIYPSKTGDYMGYKEN